IRGDEPRRRRGADDAVPARGPARPRRVGPRRSRRPASRADPLPRGLRRALPGVRARPEPDAARARDRAQRPALGRAREPQAAAVTWGVRLRAPLMTD